MELSERIAVAPDLQHLIPGYLASRREDLREMLGLLAAPDYRGLAVLAHNIKGNGGFYGFPEISRIGAELEQSAKHADQLTSVARVAELSDFLDRMESEFKIGS